MRSTQRSRFSVNESSFCGGFAPLGAGSEWLGGTGGGGIDGRDGGGIGDACDLTPFESVRGGMCTGWNRPSSGPVVATGVTGVAGD